MLLSHHIDMLVIVAYIFLEGQGFGVGYTNFKKESRIYTGDEYWEE